MSARRRALGVPRLDRVVLSHGDNDHAGGWSSVAKAFPVAALLAPAGSPAPGITACIAGQSWDWDGVRFRVLHPTPWFPYLGNEASCVLRIETAHGRALLTGDIGGVVKARRLSRAAISNIMQNLAFAFGYNALLLPVAAGALYPAFGLLLSPMLAAGAMALSSVFVVTNALRLRRLAL